MGAEELSVGYAERGDTEWLAERDTPIGRELLEQKVARHEYLVARRGELRVGWLRLSFFWSRIPCIDVILVEPQSRRQGVGRAMLRFLEDRARADGQPIIMSSSQADEPEPQAWHRHVGFRDAGAIVDFGPVQDVPEIIFIKATGADDR